MVENPRTGMFSKRSVSFTGHPETAARLNGSQELLTLAEKVAVSSVRDQSQTRSIGLLCSVLPQPEGALLAVQLAAAIETRL